MSRRERPRALVVTALGIGQILAWGSSYYLPAVLAAPVAADTGWPLPWIVAGLSIGSLTAGLIAHRVGHVIQLRGGRPAMIAGLVLLAAGQGAAALAPSLPFYLLGWLVIGLGMGFALYDAAFSTLGRLYGQDARQAITALTLFGGFASTICWPLTAFLLERFGWRGTHLAYAVILVVLTVPLYLLALPSSPPAEEGADAPSSSLEGAGVEEEAGTGRPWLVFLPLAAAIGLGWAISSVLSVHLLTILQSRGFELAAAVTLGVLVGPSQVAGRAVEMLLGKRYHPAWTLLISTALVATGLGLLTVGASLMVPAIICYGAGAGIASIARGTLPLALFGPDHYAIWMGRLAGPTLIAGALSPALAAVLLARAGSAVTLYVLEGLALLNLLIAIMLWRGQSSSGGAERSAAARSDSKATIRRR